MAKKKEREIVLTQSELEELIRDLRQEWMKQIWEIPFFRDAMLHFADYLEQEKKERERRLLANWWPRLDEESDDDEIKTIN